MDQVYDILIPREFYQTEDRRGFHIHSCNFEFEFVLIVSSLEPNLELLRDQDPDLGMFSKEPLVSGSPFTMILWERNHTWFLSYFSIHL